MGSSVCPPAVESLMGPRVSASAAGRPQLRGRVPFSVHVWCCRGLAGLCRASQVVPGRPSARRRMCTQCPATRWARPGLSACPGTSFEAQFKCHIYTDSFPGLWLGQAIWSIGHDTHFWSTHSTADGLLRRLFQDPASLQCRLLPTAAGTRQTLAEG